MKRDRFHTNLLCDRETHQRLVETKGDLSASLIIRRLMALYVIDADTRTKIKMLDSDSVTDLQPYTEE